MIMISGFNHCVVFTVSSHFVKYIWSITFMRLTKRMFKISKLANVAGILVLSLRWDKPNFLRSRVEEERPFTKKLTSDLCYWR